MDKNILEQYEDMKKERTDTEQRIRQTEKELERFNKKYMVKDTVKGGSGGIQHFTVEGFPYPEYEQKKSLLLSRKLRLEHLEEKLEKQLEEVEKFIDTIENSRKRRILKYKYVDGLSWRDVAKKMGPGNNEDSVRIEIKRFLERT